MNNYDSKCERCPEEYLRGYNDAMKEVAKKEMRRRRRWTMKSVLIYALTATTIAHAMTLITMFF